MTLIDQVFNALGWGLGLDVSGFMDWLAAANQWIPISEGFVLIVGWAGFSLAWMIYRRIMDVIPFT